MAQGTDIFNSISVNLDTGEFSYPKIPGFKLDMERVVSAVKIHAQFAPTMELAVKHAIHGQISAHLGMMDLLGQEVS